MRADILRWFFAFLMILCSLTVQYGQDYTSVALPDKDTVEIGDIIHLKVKISLNKAVSFEAISFANYGRIVNMDYSIDTVNMDKYADVEILNPGHWQNISEDGVVPKSMLNITSSGDKIVIENDIAIAIYNDGRFVIPGPEILSQVALQSLPVASSPIIVNLPESLMSKDSLALNPIKDIIKEKANITDYYNVLILVLTLILMGLLYFFYKRQKEKKEVTTLVNTPTIKLPAGEKALLALKELDSQQLWQNNKIKEYQSGLTNIVRTYLHDRYDIKAVEMTTQEIITSLQKKDFDSSYKDELTQILQVADLVKFAKAVPEDDIHSRFMERAIDFVLNTRDDNLLTDKKQSGDA